MIFSDKNRHFLSASGGLSAKLEEFSEIWIDKKRKNPEITGFLVFIMQNWNFV